MSSSKQPRSMTDQQRRLAELRERQARFALLKQQSHGVVDMAAEGFTAFVAVEHRRVDAIGQHRADEERVAFQRGQN